jgi:hypothetical protein
MYGEHLGFPGGFIGLDVIGDRLVDRGGWSVDPDRDP